MVFTLIRISPSTEAGDRGFKFERYQNIESLREYVLISQQKPRVETFLRLPDGSWRYQSFDGLDAHASVGIDVPLAEIYDGSRSARGLLLTPAFDIDRVALDLLVERRQRNP